MTFQFLSVTKCKNVVDVFLNSPDPKGNGLSIPLLILAQNRPKYGLLARTGQLAVRRACIWDCFVPKVLCRPRPNPMCLYFRLFLPQPAGKPEI